MAIDETNRLLDEIAQRLAEDTAYPLDGTLLYALVTPGMVSPSIFKDRGNHIVFRWPDLDRICSVLSDLWDAADPKKRWAEIAYLIRGHTFRVEYFYADAIDPDEDRFDRRDRIVRGYFGDKPTTYPPMPDDDGFPSYDL